MKNKSGTNNGSNNPNVPTWRFDPPLSTAPPGGSPAEILSHAAALHQSGQLEAAEPLYREVLTRQADNGDALHLLGVLHYQRRDPAAAVPLIEAALKLIPGNIHAWAGLGLALLKLNRFDEALDTFDRALSIKPDYAEALARRGEALQGLGRQKEALAAFNRSLRYRPDHVETLNNRAVALISLDRVSEALSSLGQALALNPHYVEALNNSATALIALKRNTEALDFCHRALSIQPGLPETLCNCGVALRNLGRKGEAVPMFHAALASKPDSAEFHSNLGMTLQDLGQFEEAEQSLRRAVETRKSAFDFLNLGSLLYRAGKIGEATQTYQQCLELEPDNPIAQHLAAVGSMTAPERASNQYVASLFNEFAESFDAVLGGLGYNLPQVLHAMLKAERGTDSTRLRVLDAGCGTGLAAPLLRPMASQLVGVDLSSAMIEKARERKLYDELVVDELCVFMASRPGAFDVILLADTLVYFGALEHAFRTAHVALQPGGILVFALELLPARTGGPAYRLEPHGRYSHSADYVTELLAKTGYTLCAIQQDAFRKEMDADVAGLAVVARRTAG